MNDETIELAKHALLAAGGGLVRELKLGGNPKLRRFIGGAFIAVFCGVLAHYVCQWRHVEGNLASAITGLSGYAGVPLLDFGTSQLRKLMRKLFDPETKTKPGEQE